MGSIGSRSRSREVKRSKEVKNPLRKNYWTKFGGKIHVHNCDWKNKFDFGSDRVKVKVKRGQKRSKERSKTHYAKTIRPNLMKLVG